MTRFSRLSALAPAVAALVALALLLAACAPAPSGQPTQTAPAPTPTATGLVPGSPESAALFPEQLKFEPFTLDPAMRVTSILPDRDGFLWFGAEDGLYRYDGYSFKPHRPDPQLWPDPAGTPVHLLFQDRAGRLWAGVADGLARFDPETGAWRRYLQRRGAGGNETDGLSAGPISGAVEDTRGQVWVATDGGGLNRLDPETGRVQRFSHRSATTDSPGSDAITALIVGRGGELWMGARHGGLDRLDPATGRFSHFDPSRTSLSGSFGETGSFAGGAIHALVEDPAGDLWLAVPTGILGFDPQLGSFTFFANPAAQPETDDPSSLVMDVSGSLWMGTEGAGLYRFSPRTGKWSHHSNDPHDAYSLSEDSITGLSLDHSGLLWIGFTSGRVDRFDSKAGFRIYRSVRGNPNSLSDNTITTVLVDAEGAWWVGTRFGGLNRFDPQTGFWTHYRRDPELPGGLNDDWVTSLAEDPDGNIWVGTAFGGLNGFDPQRGRWEEIDSDPSTSGLSDPHIHSLVAGPDGKIWVGADDGVLNRFDPGSGRFQHYSPPQGGEAAAGPRRLDRAITALAQEADGWLWVGTEDGRFYGFDPHTGTWSGPHLLVPPNDAPPAPINALWVDENGLVWIGSGGAGLFRFNPADESLGQYSTAEGLPDNNLFGILDDRRGALWLSTGRGISSFDLAGGEIQNFDASDGLPGDPFAPGAVFRSRDGVLFFGSVSGLLVFHPGQVRANPHVPPVVITDFQLFYESAPRGSGSPWQAGPEGDEIRLGYTQNVFTFEYAALDFSNPADNQYAYRLEGFDEDWVFAGARRQASYTNLPPGEYVFRVKGSNSAGVWNEDGAAVRVVIQPPFWVTSWFRFLAVTLVLVAAVGGVSLRLRAADRQQVLLQEQVDERTRELNQALKQLEASREAAERAAVFEERQRLARELHDSVTQLLYGQVLSADISSKLLKKGDLDALEENLNKLGEIAGQSLKEMRLLLYELRPSSFEEEGLVNALELRLDAVERRSRIESILEVQGSPSLPDSQAWEVYRIAIEALNNSLKHASATRVVVRLSSVDGCVALEVEDNGSGFEADGGEKGGFGIRSMRQRAKRLGGELKISSQPGQGACVRVEVKV